MVHIHGALYYQRHRLLREPPYSILEINKPLSLCRFHENEKLFLRSVIVRSHKFEHPLDASEGHSFEVGEHAIDILAAEEAPLEHRKRDVETSDIPAKRPAIVPPLAAPQPRLQAALPKQQLENICG
jgi:hypothetical protein